MSYSEGRQRSPGDSHHRQRSPTDSTTMSMSIPIPPHSHQNHYPPDRSPDGGRSLVSPSSSSRSPQPSLSSYRAHPYPRRHSVSTQAASSHSQDERIFLPPPNSAAPLHVLHERRDSRDSLDPRDPRDPRDLRDRDQRSPLDVRDSRGSPWNDRRPSLPRTQSERYGNERGFQLPSFSSLSSSSAGPLTPTSAPSGSMGPPSALPNTSPGSSRTTSPKPYPLGGLRPSYSYEPSGSTSNGSSAQRGPSLGLMIGSNSTGGPNSSYRNDPSPTRYPGSDRASPPLHPINGYGHRNSTLSAHPAHAAVHQAGRARSHSAASALGRYGGPSAPSSDSGDWAGPQTPQAPVPPSATSGGGGQNRRVAHLLSEQKRRESINTGFKALRATLPTSVSGDSKAIVLRKAVSHINYLEDLLRKNGIDYGAAPPPTPGAPSLPALIRGDSGSTQGGEADEENEDDDDEDVPMREATGRVATLQVGKKQQQEQIEWKHIENVNGQA